MKDGHGLGAAHCKYGISYETHKKDTKGYCKIPEFSMIPFPFSKPRLLPTTAVLFPRILYHRTQSDGFLCVFAYRLILQQFV
ncbi:hypothetical protein B9Z55_014263 [Caenorhabditis nigoni]|uniref:Uncharacterized protein n=1 Tax=Caenorhabditis nigoni TaxID=1611254 RepID=A0A2G5U549_9PELO|nr:hypothetical protein B9Z55_014263 [Caenorhabditis nigoni]